MTHRRLIVLLTLLSTACASAPLRGATAANDRTQARGQRREQIKSVLPQNVRVVVVNDGAPVRSASGVVLGNGLEDGGVASFVVTNAHVVSPRGDEKPTFVVLIDLPTGDTQEFGARVLASGKVPDSDLAILSVPGLALDPVRLADDEELSVGDDIFVVAAPYGRSLSVSGGMVSQVDLDRDSPHRPVMIKTDAAIGYGASGGGMFSAETGKLLGIVEGYRTAKVSIPVATDTYSFDVPMPGETFAAPAAKIRRFLEQKGLSRVLGAARSASPVAAAN